MDELTLRSFFTLLIKHPFTVFTSVDNGPKPRYGRAVPQPTNQSIKPTEPLKADRIYEMEVLYFIFLSSGRIIPPRLPNIKHMY